MTEPTLPATETSIAGYRVLNQREIDAINRFKALGLELELALREVGAVNAATLQRANEAYQRLCDVIVQTPVVPGNPGIAPTIPRWDAIDPELRAAHAAANESNRALALAKTNLQQGLMWAVRAVAQPEGF
jgi:hypothetical protein